LLNNCHHHRDLKSPAIHTCHPTRTVMVTIYVTGDMIELLYLITTSEIS